MKARNWFVIALLALIALGCSAAPDPDQPPEILYGEDVCHSCNMIINEPRFAAAYYTAEGEARSFDDIGEMAKYHASQGEQVARFWVHDYETEAWLMTEQATFVMGEGIHTPMGFGVVAFGEQASAQAFANETDARLLSFEEVLAHYAAPQGAHGTGGGQHEESKEGRDPG